MTVIHQQVKGGAPSPNSASRLILAILGASRMRVAPVGLDGRLLTLCPAFARGCMAALCGKLPECLLSLRDALDYGVHLDLRRWRDARRTGLVAQQTLNPFLGEVLLPAPHRWPADADPLGMTLANGAFVYLENGGTLESAQAMGTDESPRTTKLYGRTSDAITLDDVKRIKI